MLAIEIHGVLKVMEVSNGCVMIEILKLHYVEICDIIQYTTTFSLHQGGVVISSQIKHTHSHQDTPLSPYT